MTQGLELQLKELKACPLCGGGRRGKLWSFDPSTAEGAPASVHWDRKTAAKLEVSLPVAPGLPGVSGAGPARGLMPRAGGGEATPKGAIESIEQSRPLTVYRCLDCGLSYLDPCLDSKSMAGVYESSGILKRLNEFHEGYYEYGDLKTRTNTLRGFERILAMAERHRPPPERKLFEVGFGNGLFLALARERGWQVDGIDTSSRNVQLARDKFSLELSHGFFEDSPNETSRYTAVAILDVIEHTEDPHFFIRKAWSMLASGGILILATPNEAGFLGRLSRWLYKSTGGWMDAGLRKIYVLEHVAYYNLKTLIELVRVNRFEPLEWFYTSTDLARYRLKRVERIMAEAVLFAGRLLRLENRVVLAARKIS